MIACYVDWRFGVPFLVLLAAWGGLELWGVFVRRQQRGDTISEIVWAIRDHHSTAFALIMYGVDRLAAWLPDHFRKGGK